MAEFLCMYLPANQAVIIRKTCQLTIMELFMAAKTKKLQMKNCYVFVIFARNTDCGYSLEPPHQGGSNGFPQSMLIAEIRKIMYTPANPFFSI